MLVDLLVFVLTCIRAVGSVWVLCVTVCVCDW